MVVVQGMAAVATRCVVRGFSGFSFGRWVPPLACALMIAGNANAQAVPQTALTPQGGLPQGNVGAVEATAQASATHPLDPAIELAKKGLAEFGQRVQDYSCTIVKRERIDGTLGDHEYMFAKVRQQPFSVYLSFLGPDAVKGQEVIWVDGRNDGNMFAHAGSGVRAMVGTVSLKPSSMLAMAGQRYAITEIGVENLARRLLEVAQHDRQFGECEVNFFPNAKVNGRVCTCLQVVHPVARKNFRFHLARVFIDDEMQIPIRYESYDWPDQPGGQPLLMEEYTYMNVKLNNGFTDADFDPRNASYNFGMK
ncbi:MAG: DUF1571 domain-containing protein [Planctomycetaceae bacterium]